MSDCLRFVVGIDLSLTATGFADYSLGDRTFESLTYGTTGRRKDTYKQRAGRLEGMAEHVVALTTAGPVDPQMVVIEGPSIGSVNGSQHDRSGLWWIIVNRFHRLDIPVLVVPPKTRAKYATGNGNSGKDVVLAHVIEQYADFVPNGRIANDNEADAIVLAAIGARYLGEPQEDYLPQSNLDAMEGIAPL